MKGGICKGTQDGENPLFTLFVNCVCGGAVAETRSRTLVYPRHISQGWCGKFRNSEEWICKGVKRQKEDNVPVSVHGGDVVWVAGTLCNPFTYKINKILMEIRRRQDKHAR